MTSTTLKQDRLDRLADEVLTFIEQREAEQIAYGVYDVTLTGEEIFQHFRRSDSADLPVEERDAALHAVLTKLVDEVHIIRFDADADPKQWIFRSRIAEMVRLLALLRQRIVFSDSAKRSHRLSAAPRLVDDVTLTVMSRRVPQRNLPASSILTTERGNADEYQRAMALVLEAIEQALPKLRMMSGFQKRSFDEILDAIERDPQRNQERGVVVTASTGAGKTYAFFLPVLVKAILERCFRERKGVKAICIYPRVALSENQFDDFIEILFHVNRVLEREQLPAITIGIESGATVYDLKDLCETDKEHQERLARMRGWTYDPDNKGYLAPFAYCIGKEGFDCYQSDQRLLVSPPNLEELFCPRCKERYPFIRFARHKVMEQHPPDILLATTESLNRRLGSARYQYLFGNQQFCSPSVVMLDEIHLQTSTAGTQVALLLRRLLARIRRGREDRKEQHNLAFVGLSATIAHPVQFLADLTGLPVTRISEVKPFDDELEVIGAERFIFVRAREKEDIAIISTLIQTTMCVLHTMPQPAPASGLERYRAFGFVQSLDIVGRWLYQMEDAEKARDYQQQKIAQYQQAKKLIGDWKITDVPLFMYR